MATKTLAAAAAVALSLAAPARADTQTIRTWFNDGNFIVTEDIGDNGSSFCTALRGNADAKFGVFAAPNFIAFDLMDRGQSWRGGQVVLTIDGREWTATATVSQKYPEQLWIQPQVGSAQLKSFVTALYNGVTLTVAGYGKPYPFSYQVSLAGSYGALDAARQCVNSLIAQNPSPAPIRPTAPAVQRYI
jgi:uncharacterized protein (DUF2147 family)